MKAFVLDHVDRLRAHLATRFAVYEPRLIDTELRWARADAPGATSFAARAALPLASPKQFFFAERESLFRFEGHRFVETLPEVEPCALLGVRACDLSAIAHQDRFFARDPYYARRRAATLLVGFDCALPCERGFCHAFDAGPAVRDGTADLVLSRDDDTQPWTLVLVTATGETAIAGLALADAASDWAHARRAREAIAVRAFPDAQDVRTAMRGLNAGAVTAAEWEALGLRCLGCSGCTTVCPTCSCFATADVREPEWAESAHTRQRFWDSCLYEGFQREAGGHHPAATPGQRVERFWTHKLSDAFVAVLGRYGCVGCGRCDQTCPGFIGARSVFARIGVA